MDMENFLEQFKKLPQELQLAVSSEEKVKNLEAIEKKYNLKLAKLVVRLMIKDLTWLDLEKFCQENFQLNPEKAGQLKKDLAEKIFNEVMGYLTKELRVEELGVKGEEKVEKKLIETMPSPAITKLVETGQDELALEKAVEEIKMEKIEGLEKEPIEKELKIEEIIKKVKEKSGLSFSDEILEKRFENVVLNFLKDLRKDFETEEVLTRSEKIAGLGLSTEKAAAVVNLLKKLKVKSYEFKREEKFIETKKPALAEGILTPKEIIKGPIQEVSPTISKVEEMPLEKSLETEKFVETRPPLAKLAEEKNEKPEETLKIDEDLKRKFNGGSIMPAFKNLEKNEEEFKDKIKKEKKFFSLPTKSQEELISIPIKRSLNEEKLITEDISARPRSLGPIEELQEIDLVDFRRWGSAKEAMQLILNKINLLAEESLLKKDQGIKSWHLSPLYKLYVEIGLEALEKQKSVEEIIHQRIQEGRETLNLEEFKIIGEFNQKLRF